MTFHYKLNKGTPVFYIPFYVPFGSPTLRATNISLQRRTITPRFGGSIPYMIPGMYKYPELYIASYTTIKKKCRRRLTPCCTSENTSTSGYFSRIYYNFLLSRCYSVIIYIHCLKVIDQQIAGVHIKLPLWIQKKKNVDELRGFVGRRKHVMVEFY